MVTWVHDTCDMADDVANDMVSDMVIYICPT